MNLSEKKTESSGSGNGDGGKVVATNGNGERSEQDEATTDKSERKRNLLLSLGALGVVYGDIGTSPLYALQQSFFGTHPVAEDPTNIYGIVSLIFWSLMILISGKYLAYVMQADNKGEGGTVALLALLNPWHARAWSTRHIVLLLGLFGSAMLYAGCSITPALSVMSAIEGLNVATQAFKPYVVPITVVILIGLFMIQKRGTESIGRLFGPVLLLWFVVIGILGISGIVREPEILFALNPWYAVHFFGHNGFEGYLVLAAVFLCMTGGEAMYADMGHFGVKAVRWAWYGVVLPSVLLSYFGQGAVLLSNPGEIQQPFFELAPSWALYPLVGFATVATVIASQAVISGAFSMTRQFVQVGQLPRTRVTQTSKSGEYGQIYIASVNWFLMLATLVAVVGFGSSTGLAAAYGISVSATTLVTTILAFFVARRVGWRPFRSARWEWLRDCWLFKDPRWMLVVLSLITIGFLIADVAYFGANLFQFFNGAWYPIVLAILLFIVMTTWARGRLLLRQYMLEASVPPEELVARLEKNPPYRIPGTGVFFTADDRIPPRLLHHLERHRVLQENVLLLIVKTLDVPRVPAVERLELVGIGPGINRVVIKYGFMQEANVPLALKLCNKLGLEFDMQDMTYYMGRETLIPSREVGGMSIWRERLFSFLSHNARPPTAFYDLPPEDVVELGFQVKI